MAPTTTTGMGVFTVRFRKYAVSSSVAVPCVTTIPASVGSAAAVRWIRSSSSSQMGGLSCVLATFL